MITAKRIFKYPFERGRTFQMLHMPQGAKILCVQMQHGVVTLWAELKVKGETMAHLNEEPVPYVDSEERVFLVIGTGQVFDVEGSCHYVGTVREDAYVWHVYEARKK